MNKYLKNFSLPLSGYISDELESILICIPPGINLHLVE